MEDKIIISKFKQAYRKCEECYNTIEKESMKNDFYQRMDEILLIYSNLFGISVDASRELLKLNAKRGLGEVKR